VVRSSAASDVYKRQLCGSPQMLAEMVDLLKRDSFTEGSSSSPGSFVIEKAFVEK
jgi:ferredoxin--NADP+ reductase